MHPIQIHMQACVYWKDISIFAQKTAITMRYFKASTLKTFITFFGMSLVLLFLKSLKSLKSSWYRQSGFYDQHLPSAIGESYRYLYSKDKSNIPNHCQLCVSSVCTESDLHLYLITAQFCHISCLTC